MLRGKKLLWLMFLWPLVAGGTEGIDPDRILTQAELVSLDRENAMWRLLRVEDDTDTNLGRLLRSGCTEDEISSIQARLIAIWEVDLQRNYGWLSKETVERIEAVDRPFIVRMRATRLFQETGIRAGPHEPETMGALDREWQRAIQRQLNDRDIAEFRLMNSSSARRVGQLVRGLSLSTDEFRTLCDWQREFDGARRVAPRLGDRFRQVWRIETNLEYWGRIRTLLGDERFAVYLGRVSVDFGQMNRAIAELDGGSPSVALELWWIRKKYEIARARTINWREASKMEAEVSAKAAALLGEAKFALFSEGEAARWVRQPN